MSDEKDDEKKVMDVDEEEDADLEEEEKPQDTILKASGLATRYRLLRESSTINDQSQQDSVMKELMQIYDENNMIEFYRDFVTQNALQLDESLVAKWEKKKGELLSGNQEKKALAEKNEGDVEIHEVELERAKILSFTSDLETSITAYLDIKGLTTGKQIDKYLTILRLCLAWNDDHAYKTHMAEAEKLIDKGGDWDRRNRFTVYTSSHYFRIRKFEEAAQGLLDSIATFSANEIFNYEQLVQYVIISSILSLNRSVIKEKLVESPEIIQVIDKLPVFKSLLSSFYECRYNEFLRSLIDIQVNFIRFDMYLHCHSNWFFREIRLRAYSQFLQSYQSVKMQSMATEFGVSIDFLDKELSSFIASNRLNCKIDKVNGIVHINRINSKNNQYQQIIKKGDLLLNRIQRLSRIITY